MLASSSPVRDWESFAGRQSGHRTIVSFRGASGIDGTLSLAAGIAQQWQRLVLVTGDLALLHDANGWLWRRQLSGELRLFVIDNGGGVIISTTSGAGSGAVNGLGVYGAAKAGVNSLTRSIAVEHGRSGIRANAIAPSSASPGMLAYLDTLPGGAASFMEAQPMGRIGDALEIAHVAAFLGSDYASFVNGVVIPVDGGIEAMLPTPQ